MGVKKTLKTLRLLAKSMQAKNATATNELDEIIELEEELDIIELDAESSVIDEADTQLLPTLVPELEIDLPWRYNENRLVLMPVNPAKLYGYWEITNTVEKDGTVYNTQDYALALSLMAADENGAVAMVQTVEIENFGEYYFYNYLAGYTVWLEILLMDKTNGHRHYVMESQKTLMPTDHISTDTTELYLSVVYDTAGKRVLKFAVPDDLRSRPDDGVPLDEFAMFPKYGHAREGD